MSSRAFTPEAVEALGTSYPDRPCRLRHDLSGHPLLAPDALVALAERLPARNALCFRGDVDIDNASGGAPRNGLSPAETVRSIATNSSWMVLKSVDKDPEYGRLLGELLAELEGIALPATGPMLKREAFIFVSSPGAITPFHFDPEHNVLIQIQGEKVMTVFPQYDEELAPGPAHEAFMAQGDYALAWRDHFAGRGTEHRLRPGDALYVPVKAPHFVRNGDAPSISLSITWRSPWSFAEADAWGFNRILRRFGLAPRPPRPWPARNLAKAYAWRVMRKAGVR